MGVGSTNTRVGYITKLMKAILIVSSVVLGVGKAFYWHALT